MKRGMYIILSLVFLVLIVSSVSATSIFDKFFGGTGRASSQPQGVSINVVGANPVGVSIYTISDVNPLEEGIRSATFYVKVNDSDGRNDINKSSVSYEITNGATSKKSDCAFENNIDPKSLNFSCSFNMSYWESSGSWNVRVQASDYGNKTLMNGTSTFTYTESKAMKISLSTLNWNPLIPGAANQSASNQTTVNNTGNYAGQISITAFDLVGETVNTELIPASSFTVGASGLECLGTALLNSSSTTIGINANPGNLNAGGGQANIYYCIPLVPSVSSQTYSTAAYGSWVIGY